jgi:hypothetical protein
MRCQIIQLGFLFQMSVKHICCAELNSLLAMHLNEISDQVSLCGVAHSQSCESL